MYKPLDHTEWIMMIHEACDMNERLIKGLEASAAVMDDPLACKVLKIALETNTYLLRKISEDHLTVLDMLEALVIKNNL